MNNFIDSINVGGNPYEIHDPAARAMGPDEFDQEETYSEGDYCIYQNALYKFTADKVAGVWDSTKVSMTTVPAELQALKEKNDELTQKIQNKIQYDVVPEGKNRDLYLMFQRVTDVEFSNGVGYVNNNLSGGDRVVRAFAQPENVTGVVIASCQAQSANNRMELHCINIDDGTPYSGNTVGYINLLILVIKDS